MCGAPYRSLARKSTGGGAQTHDVLTRLEPPDLIAFDDSQSAGAHRSPPPVVPHRGASLVDAEQRQLGGRCLRRLYPTPSECVEVRQDGGAGEQAECVGRPPVEAVGPDSPHERVAAEGHGSRRKIGRASCRERVLISVVAVSLKTKDERL